jgi:RHS repeat-associated protein
MPPSTTTTLYLYAMGQMEEKVSTLTSTTWRDYIQADGKFVAERFNTLGNVSLSYFVTDHLGSVAVVTDASGAISEHDVYDAWGKRLNSDWSDDTTCSLSSSTTRGFTGHEEMDSVCLINMNARVYEPTIGRFMSADSVVPDPLDLQTFNRYSYVNNNPLSFTDPTGHCSGFVGCVFAIGSFGIFEPFMPSLLHDAPLLGDLFIMAAGMAAGPAGAAVMAAGVTAEESGKTGAVLRAFVYTLAEETAMRGLNIGIGSLHLEGLAYSATEFVGQGAVGGTFSVLNGGKFGAGFLSAGVGSLALPSTGSSFVDFFAHATLGGFASVLGGGKFGNGAVTASFAYAATSIAEESSSSEVDSRYATKAQIDKAMQDGASVDRANAEAATERVKAHYAAHPEDLPGDIESADFNVVYDHLPGPRGTTAGHIIVWRHDPTDGSFVAAAGIEGNTITLYLGSSDTQLDAMKTLFHEIGHHSEAAVALSIKILNANPNADINTREVEDAADQYARSMIEKSH